MVGSSGLMWLRVLKLLLWVGRLNVARGAAGSFHPGVGDPEPEPAETEEDREALRYLLAAAESQVMKLRTRLGLNVDGSAIAGGQISERHEATRPSCDQVAVDAGCCDEMGRIIRTFGENAAWRGPTSPTTAAGTAYSAATKNELCSRCGGPVQSRLKKAGTSVHFSFDEDENARSTPVLTIPSGASTHLRPRQEDSEGDNSSSSSESGAEDDGDFDRRSTPSALTQQGKKCENFILHQAEQRTFACSLFPDGDHEVSTFIADSHAAQTSPVGREGVNSSEDGPEVLQKTSSPPSGTTAPRSTRQIKNAAFRSGGQVEEGPSNVKKNRASAVSENVRKAARKKEKPAICDTSSPTRSAAKTTTLADDSSRRGGLRLGSDSFQIALKEQAREEARFLSRSGNKQKRTGNAGRVQLGGKTSTGPQHSQEAVEEQRTSTRNAAYGSMLPQPQKTDEFPASAGDQDQLADELESVRARLSRLSVSYGDRLGQVRDFVVPSGREITNACDHLVSVCRGAAVSTANDVIRWVYFFHKLGCSSVRGLVKHIEATDEHYWATLKERLKERQPPSGKQKRTARRMAAASRGQNRGSPAQGSVEAGAIVQPEGSSCASEHSDAMPLCTTAPENKTGGWWQMCCATMVGTAGALIFAHCATLDIAVTRCHAPVMLQAGGAWLEDKICELEVERMRKKYKVSEQLYPAEFDAVTSSGNPNDMIPRTQAVNRVKGDLHARAIAAAKSEVGRCVYRWRKCSIDELLAEIMDGSDLDAEDSDGRQRWWNSSESQHPGGPGLFASTDCTHDSTSTCATEARVTDSASVAHECRGGARDEAAALRVLLENAPAVEGYLCDHAIFWSWFPFSPERARRVNEMSPEFPKLQFYIREACRERGMLVHSFHALFETFDEFFKQVLSECSADKDRTTLADERRVMGLPCAHVYEAIRKVREQCGQQALRERT
ncbi:unnamed protein product [Amoebophrya sp. A120]|nr:unnamed protein product [Amoebophrya sp. A120]|eukprot:GSA120T00002555001.1